MNTMNLEQAIWAAYWSNQIDFQDVLLKLSNLRTFEASHE